MQIASYSEFKRAKSAFLQLTHAPAVSLQDQIATNALTVRIHINFISPFRALDVAERNLHMYSVVTDNMQRKIDRLEQALRTLIPLDITPRHAPACDTWNAPETHVEPDAAEEPEAIQMPEMPAATTDSFVAPEASFAAPSDDTSLEEY
eukprot:s873_g30.t1